MPSIKTKEDLFLWDCVCLQTYFFSTCLPLPFFQLWKNSYCITGEAGKNFNSVVSEPLVTMAAESPVSLSQPCVPVFKGEDYGRWCLRMKTVFRSQELWELVEKGAAEGEDEVKMKENKKKDAKALCLIQQAVDGPILDRIEEAETAHAAWEIIKKLYQGSSKMMTVRKQALRQSFETTPNGRW